MLLRNVGRVGGRSLLLVINLLMGRKAREHVDRASLRSS